MPIITVTSSEPIFPLFFTIFFLTDKYGERFCSILTTALTSNTWKVQVVLLAAIKLFIERLVIIIVIVIFVCLFLKACFSFIAHVGYDDFFPAYFLAHQNGLDLWNSGRGRRGEYWQDSNAEKSSWTVHTTRLWMFRFVTSFATIQRLNVLFNHLYYLLWNIMFFQSNFLLERIHKWILFN